MITLEQKTELLTYLNKKWKRHECFHCEKDSWDVQGFVVLTLGDSPRSITQKAFLPTAALICKNCGNTVLINLKIAGMV